MRAAAWCAHQVWTNFGIPPRRAILLPGDGVVRVQRRGHTSHMNVSNLAGFHDRSDPGPNFSYRHLYELTKFLSRAPPILISAILDGYKSGYGGTPSGAGVAPRLVSKPAGTTRRAAIAQGHAGCTIISATEPVRRPYGVPGNG